MSLKPIQQARTTALIFFIIALIEGIVVIIALEAHSNTLAISFSFLGVFFLLGSLFYFFRYRFYHKRAETNAILKDEPEDNKPIK